MQLPTESVLTNKASLSQSFNNNTDCGSGGWAGNSNLHFSRLQTSTHFRFTISLSFSFVERTNLHRRALKWPLARPPARPAAVKESQMSQLLIKELLMRVSELFIIFLVSCINPGCWCC
jgi:hypothetical protein